MQRVQGRFKADARDGLQFPSHLLQLQWVNETLKCLEAEAVKSGTPLDDKHPLVSPLLKSLSSLTILTAQAGHAVLLSATLQGWLDSHAVLTSLISLTPSMTLYPLAVATIRRLLEGQLQATLATQGRRYVCPYSLRTNAHPFISVLMSCPKAGPCLVTEVMQMLRNKQVQCTATLDLLQPFIKFLLLHPSPSLELAAARSLLYRELLSPSRRLPVDAAEGGNQPLPLPIVQLLVKLLPLQHLGTDDQLTSVAAMCRELVPAVMQTPGQGKAGLLPALLDICLALCCELVPRGLAAMATGILGSIEAMVLVDVSLVHAHHCLAVSWLLLQSLVDPHTAQGLLHVCNLLVPGVAHCSQRLLVFPLVQLLSQPRLPTVISHDLRLTNQKAASELLLAIEQKKHTTVAMANQKLHPRSLPSPQYSLLVSAALTYQRLHLPNTAAPSLSQWLHSLLETLDRSPSAPPGSFNHILIILAALSSGQKVGMENEEELLGTVLEAFTAVARADPTTSPSILPVLLHLLSSEPAPSSQLALLQSLPSLATHALSTTSIVNTLLVLGASPSLTAMATRLMSRVWRLQDSVFPRLRSLLTHRLPPSLSTAVGREIELARAATIKDICCLRPEQHGEEMLSLISGIMDQSRDPLTVSMATEGLVSLCRAEVVDVVTVWKVLGGRLRSDDRPAVMVGVCQMFELASTLDPENASHQLFKSTALKGLWSCTFSPNKHVCSAALTALSKFPPEDQQSDYLPAQVVTRLGLALPDSSHDQSHDPDVVIPLAGTHYLQLVQYIPVPSLPAFSSFLSCLLAAELREVQRGVVYSALRQCHIPSQLEKTVDSIPGKLRRICGTMHDRDGPAGLIAATHMSVYEVHQLASPRISRQAVSDALHQYTTMLDVFLTEGKFSLDASGPQAICSYLGAGSIAGQWRTFMSGVMSAFCQVRLLETCPVSVREDPNDPILLEKQEEACRWARKQVVSRLADFVRENAQSASNVLLGLVGLACAHSPYARVGHVTSPDQSEYTKQALLVELVECLTAVLADGELPWKATALSAVVQALARTTPLTHLRPAALLCVPVLTEELVLSGQGEGPGWSARLEALGHCMFTVFSSTPQWYTAVSLGAFLTDTVPICSHMTKILDNISPFVTAALHTDSHELLSLISAFLPALCVSSDHRQSSHELLEHLHSTLSSLTPLQLTQSATQLCSLHMAMATPTLFTSGQLAHQDVMKYVSLLAELATNANNVGTYHLGLGASLHGLLSAGHPGVATLATSIASKWLGELEAGSPDQVVAVLCGLAGLVGVSPAPQKNGVVPLNFLQNFVPVVTAAMEKLAATHGSDAVCATAVWLLGQVHHRTSARLAALEKIPQSYGYLPEGSLLPSLHQTLQSLSMTATPSQSPEVEVVQALLQVLGSAEEQLPPVSFTSILTTLFMSRELLEACVGVLVHCSGRRGGLGLGLFAAHCCSPAVFVSLQLPLQCLLAKNLSSLTLHLSTAQLSNYLRMLCTLSLHQLSQCQDLVAACLKGLRVAVEGDALDSVTGRVLCTAVAEMYQQLVGWMEEEEERLLSFPRGILEDLAACVGQREKLVDAPRLLSALKGSHEIPMVPEILSCIIHCSWVMSGRGRFTAEGTRDVTRWVLTHAEHPMAAAPISWLLRVIHSGCHGGNKSFLLHQTDMFHTLLTWTRDSAVPTSDQMRLVLFLASRAVTDPSRHGHPLSFSWDPGALHLPLPLAPGTPPPLRDKFCQCLVEWLGMVTAEPVLRQTCLGWFGVLKSTEEFQKSVIWTSVGHLL